MSELPLLLAVFWGALNPPASLASLPNSFGGVAREQRARLLVAAWALAAALLALAALLHEPLFDLLEVSPPSFDVAAGIVMLVGAVRPLVHGRAIEETTASLADGGRRSALAPLAVPLLATPAALAAAVSYGERAGEGATIAVAIAIAGLAALLLAAQPLLGTCVGRAIFEALARLGGALLVVSAIGLIVDGVFTI